MSLSHLLKSSVSIALLALVPLLIPVTSELAQARGRGMDLSVTCEFVRDAQVLDPQGFAGPGLLVAGSVSGPGDSSTASPGDHICGGVSILLEEQGKGPWTRLLQSSADASADGTFSQLLRLCGAVLQNPDASVVRATASVLVSGTSCTDGSTKTLTSRCTDGSEQGNRPAIKLPPAFELDVMCADANI